MVALWLRWYHLAPVTAMIQVALILWGYALAQYPLLVPPDIDIKTSAAPPMVLKSLLAAVGAGLFILLPSDVLSFPDFQGTHLPDRLGIPRLGTIVRVAKSPKGGTS